MRTGRAPDWVREVRVLSEDGTSAGLGAGSEGFK